MQRGSIGLGLLHSDLVAFAVDVGDVERAQLAGSKAAAIQHQHHQPIAPIERAAGHGCLHELLGFLEGQVLGGRASQRVLQTEPIEHVALGATAAPGVLEQAAQMTQVLGEA